MTLEDKLKYSEITNQEEKTLKSVGILTKKQRKRSWIIFAVLVVYTIISKIILNISNLTSNPIQVIFDPIFFLTFLNLIILLFLKIFGKSTTALNHLKLNRFVIFLNKFCKAAIFCFTTRAYFIHFQMMIPENYDMTVSEALLLVIKDRSKAQEIFVDVLFSDLKLASFLLSIVLSISSIIYVLFAFAKILLNLMVSYWLYCVICGIPILNIIYFVRKIKSDEGSHFKHYRLTEDGEKVIIEHRQIHPDVFKQETLLKRILLHSPFLIYSICYDLLLVFAIVMLSAYYKQSVAA